MKQPNPCCTKNIRRLNRRQRKKLHLGEFQEKGFALHWAYRTLLKEPAVDIFFDQFISMIEGCGLCFAGGCAPEGSEGFVARLGRGTVAPEDRVAVLAWLRASPDVASAEADQFVDSWYGW